MSLSSISGGFFYDQARFSCTCVQIQQIDKDIFYIICKIELFTYLYLSNFRYKEVSQQVSKLLQHDLLRVSEKINFWVDFVMKNKGHSILRNFSSSETWLESMPADVFLVLAAPLILCGIIVLYLSYRIKKYISYRYNPLEKIKRH